ncbi:MAG: DUF924 family protein [Bacteriovoracaceae bacterium]
MNRLHDFWFGEIELTPAYYEKQLRRWFWGTDIDFDRACQEKYAHLLEEEFFVPDNSRDYLSLIVLLDQVPRNAFRGSPRAYEYDHFAQSLALAALGTKFESELTLPERIFLYMPLEHAEDLRLQELSVEKFYELHRLAPKELRPWTQLGVDKAIEHQKTIQRHGLFPKRPRHSLVSSSDHSSNNPSSRFSSDSRRA